MNSMHRFLSVILLSLFIMFLSNGCSWQTKDIIVEARLVGTKEPAVGKLINISSLKFSSPPLPQFEAAVIDDGVFYTKMVDDVPSKFFFAFPNQDWNTYIGSPPSMSMYPDVGDLVKSEWRKFSDSSGDGSKAVEYRIIVLPKLKKLTRDYFKEHTYD